MTEGKSIAQIIVAIACIACANMAWAQWSQPQYRGDTTYYNNANGSSAGAIVVGRVAHSGGRPRRRTVCVVIIGRIAYCS